jgi:hypothetical protein
MTPHDSGTGTLQTGALPLEPDAAPVRPRTSSGNSLRPAMIVLGLAVLILGLFAGLAVVTSHGNAPVQSSTAPRAVPGSPLLAVPAARVLSAIVDGGEPPSDIINAVLVPKDAVLISHQDNSASAGQFDSQVVVRSTASQGALLTFFASAMKEQGWQVYDRGPAANDPGATEVLGKLAGTDGWYWVMGAVIAPTSFGPGAPAGGQTDVTIRLYQESDQF